MRAFIKSDKLMPALLAAAAFFVYAPTLSTRGFIRDDRWLIAENPVLARGAAGLPSLLASGYVEAVDGPRATVHEYRPVLALSYAAQRLTTGARPWPFHLFNIALHAAVCALFWLLAEERLGAPAAAAASLLFAVLAVHSENVSYITSRSELLAAVFMLGAWRALDAGRRKPALAAGATLFTAALLSKEHAFLFPALLALDDWAWRGRAFWRAPRRKVYLALAACAAAAAALRWAVLGTLGGGGVPYFQSGRLVAALTYARFFPIHYLLPAATGLGLCADYSRPLIPDAATSSLSAWACLLAASALIAAASGALKRRRAWGFWALAPALFLLPTCHLLVPLDTLGAERFLYMPSLGLCALAGLAFAALQMRARLAARAALGALLVWQAAMTLSRDRAWASELAYYSDAVRCNPVSAKARTGLGASLLEAGRRDEGVAELEQALRLRPGHAPAAYDLAREAWERGDQARAEDFARRCLLADPGFASAWLLLGTMADRGGRIPAAEAFFERAAALLPGSASAHFDLGRVELELGHEDRARIELERFLALSPGDPDAPAAAALVARLSRSGS